MLPTAIAPVLSVRRGKLAVEFYPRVFGAMEKFRIENDRGDVVARLSVNGAAFWLSDESPAPGNFSPETLKGSVAAGATAIHPVARQHGFLMARLADPFGHHWEIVKPLEGEG